tara:strand:- start:5039 stop:5881 length:843 start_codon:yes stop_codon:yes gene_type:complete
MYKAAVLLTVFNRKKTTLECLKALGEQEIKNVILEVFLVDDGSTDGTLEAVANQFPEVNVIQGSGSLFWNGGMRLAWKNALAKEKYDLFLWLNDDTILLKNGLNDLLRDYQKLQKIENNLYLISGACKKINSEEFSYGGRDEKGVVKPSGELQICKYINGNVVLIPYNVFLKIGILSDKYTHSMGDFDYGLRAQEKKIKCYTTSKYIAQCDQNLISGWMDQEVHFKKRWQLFHNPKGLNIKEYIYFTKRHNNYLVAFNKIIKVYFQLFFPKFYRKIKGLV